MPVMINPTPRAVAPTPMTTLTSTAPANVHFIMPTPITIATVAPIISNRRSFDPLPKLLAKANSRIPTEIAHLQTALLWAVGMLCMAPANPTKAAPSKTRSIPIAKPMKNVLVAVQVARR